MAVRIINDAVLILLAATVLVAAAELVGRVREARRRPANPELTDADLKQRFDALIASGHNGEDESAEGTPEGTALWARTHGEDATSFDLHLQAWEEERSSGVPFDRFLAQRFPTPEARMEFRHRVQQINDRTESREEE